MPPHPHYWAEAAGASVSSFSRTPFTGSPSSASVLPSTGRRILIHRGPSA